MTSKKGVNLCEENGSLETQRLLATKDAVDRLPLTTFYKLVRLSILLLLWIMIKFFSIVLMAVCDSLYRFIYIDVGTPGRWSDGGTFDHCTLKTAMAGKTLNVPHDSTLPGSQRTSPYVIVGDEAFPLQTWLMRPFPKGQLVDGETMTHTEKSVFNYRLSRARRTIEGAYFEIIGPVVPELIAQTNSDYENVLRAVSMRGAGHVIGGILGGLMVDRWFAYIDIMMAISTVLMTATGVMAAYVHSIELLFTVLLFQGSIETFINTAGHRIIFVIFKENSAAGITGVELGYQVGSVIAPLLVQPFLDGRFSGIYFTLGNRNGLKNTQLAANISTTTAKYIVPYYPANFVNAFWILSALGFVITLACIMIYVHGRITGTRIEDHQQVSTKQTIRESLALKNCSVDHPYYALCLLVLLFFFIACIFSIARIYAKVIFSYARDGPGFSVRDASLINSAFFISSSVGVLIFILPMLLMHVKFILQVTCVLVIAIGLYFLYSQIVWLWILYVALGLFMGATISAGLSMVNRYMEFTAMAQMSPQFGAAFGDVVVMYVVSWSYQSFGPYTIWKYLLFISIIMFFVTCAMQIVAMFMGDRFDKVKRSEENVEPISLQTADQQ